MRSGCRTVDVGGCVARLANWSHFDSRAGRSQGVVALCLWGICWQVLLTGQLALQSATPSISSFLHPPLHPPRDPLNPTTYLSTTVVGRGTAKKGNRPYWHG